MRKATSAFCRERSVVTRHLRNVFREAELVDVQILHILPLMRGGQQIINDIGLAALALLVAESAPTQKETMIRLIENMLVGVR